MFLDPQVNAKCRLRPVSKRSSRVLRMPADSKEIEIYNYSWYTCNDVGDMEWGDQNLCVFRN